jgi:hypothetical protein
VHGDNLSHEGALTAMGTMSWNLLKLWSHKSGQGWEKPKNLGQLHFPDGIDRNSACQNYHTGPTEHNHILHVK